MAGNVFAVAFDRVQRYAERYREVLVAFSGGRESLALLDICSKSGFDKIHCFAMYFVPGIEVFERPIRMSQAKYPMAEFHLVQHWNVFYHVKREHYCLATQEGLEFPEITFHTICRTMMDQLGVRLTFTGERLDDSLFRKFHLNGGEEVVSPIASWKRWEVLAYLKQNKIDFSFGGAKFDSAVGSGLDLSLGTLCWLYDSHPEDFEKVREIFPFIDAAIARRAWYGVVPALDHRLLNSRAKGRNDVEFEVIASKFSEYRKEIEEKYGEEEAKSFGQ